MQFLDAPSLESILNLWVAERLPLYILSAFFVQMNALPLSPNEEVNRKTLPDPIEAIRSHTTMEPSSEVEQQIQVIWSDVLGHDHIGIEDNFSTSAATPCTSSAFKRP